MSNADVSGEELLAGKLAKSTVIERGGEKLGLIGLTPQDTCVGGTCIASVLLCCLRIFRQYSRVSGLFMFRHCLHWP
jgi:hypothetical protein